MYTSFFFFLFVKMGIFLFLLFFPPMIAHVGAIKLSMLLYPT